MSESQLQCCAKLPALGVRMCETPAARPRYLSYACMTAVCRCVRDGVMLWLIFLGIYISRTRQTHAERQADPKIVQASSAAEVNSYTTYRITWKKL